MRDGRFRRRKHWTELWRAGACAGFCNGAIAAISLLRRFLRSSHVMPANHWVDKRYDFRRKNGFEFDLPICFVTGGLRLSFGRRDRCCGRPADHSRHAGDRHIRTRRRRQLRRSIARIGRRHLVPPTKIFGRCRIAGVLRRNAVRDGDGKCSPIGQ